MNDARRKFLLKEARDIFGALFTRLYANGNIDHVREEALIEQAEIWFEEVKNVAS